MARDLLWVCDQLARLHQDLETIRARRAAEQAAALAQAQDTGDGTPAQPTQTETPQAAPNANG
jgi:hypothetical protein